MLSVLIGVLIICVVGAICFWATVVATHDDAPDLDRSIVRPVLFRQPTQGQSVSAAARISSAGAADVA